ncbi:MAG: ABC transporter substrate-binding protein [Hyphomicrobiales bacterium]|nr:ABC transporter substrate-binding protein [Hyphomicrobiales bacterium]
MAFFRFFRPLGLAAAMLAAIVAPAAAEKVLRVVQHSDLKILDPIWSTAYIVRNHGYLIYDTLLAQDAKLQPQPQMAEFWKTSDDGLVTTIKLRDGLMWHDGKPVTSDDCVASLKRWSARDSMGQKLNEVLAEYKIVDDKTFQIVLKKPFGALIDALSKQSGVPPFIMPKRVAETDPFKQITETIGSGPFMFKADEWKPGEKVVYVKNPNYKPRAEPASGLAGGKVALVDRVEMIWIPDAQTQVNALQAGELDMIESVPHDLLPLVEKDPNIRTIKSSGAFQYTFRPNWLIKPFDNPKIREAAMIAMSQGDFLKAAVGDARYYASCKALFTCGTPLATDAGMKDMLNGDSARAAALLKEAGYDGTPVVILQPTDLAVLANLAPVAKSQLERAGFKVDVQAMDWQTMVGRVVKKGPASEGGWNAYLTAWAQVDILNPMTMAFLAANCDKARPGWPCDAAMERLRDDYAVATTPEARFKAAEAAQVLNARIVTQIPLGEFWNVTAVRSNIVTGDTSSMVTVYWGVDKK